MNEADWIDIFSENLREMMEEKGLGQNELARRSKLSKATVSRLLAGTAAPSFKSIINLSYALDCTTDELIDFGDMIE